MAKEEQNVNIVLVQLLLTLNKASALFLVSCVALNFLQFLLLKV